MKDSLEVSKFYIHDVESSNVVENGYSFVSPFFLPAGDVYVYIDSRYIGSFPFTETLEEESVEMMIGPTSSVSCISVIEKTEEKTKITTKIYNKTNEDIDLTIKYYVGKNAITSIPPYTERINDKLEWDLTVDNSQEYLFEVELL